LEKYRVWLDHPIVLRFFLYCIFFFFVFIINIKPKFPIFFLLIFRQLADVFKVFGKIVFVPNTTLYFADCFWIFIYNSNQTKKLQFTGLLAVFPNDPQIQVHFSTI